MPNLVRKAWREKNAAKVKKQKAASYARCKAKLSKKQLEDRKSRNNKASYKYFLKNKETRYALLNIKKLNTKLKIIKHCGNKCKDCKLSFPPECYDFHHTEPSKKDKNISVLLTCSWTTILKELRKCVMICANCHRVRHKIMGGTNSSAISKKQRKETPKLNKRFGTKIIPRLNAKGCTINDNGRKRRGLKTV